MTCEFIEKFVPVTVIAWPFVFTGALVGVRLEIVGEGGALVSTSDHAPRPWVPAISVREGSWSLRESTATLGSTVPRVFQVQTAPEQVPWKAPMSVAA